MFAVDAQRPLCVRPLAVSAAARDLLSHGTPLLRAVHCHGASVCVAGADEDVYVSAPDHRLGLLPLHLVVRRRDLASMLAAAQTVATGALPLRIDLSAVRIFASRLAADPEAMGSEQAQRNIAAVALWLRARQEPLGLGTTAEVLLAPGGMARQWVARLGEASPAGEEVLLALIGRGAGSTPAGDDFLIGMLAQSWAVIGESAPLVALLRALDDRLPLLTTSASVSYLRAAARGEFGSHLAVLVRNLARVPCARALALAARVAGHGASSGFDTLAGFVAATEAWSAGRRVSPV